MSVRPYWDQTGSWRLGEQLICRICLTFISGQVRLGSLFKHCPERRSLRLTTMHQDQISRRMVHLNCVKVCVDAGLPIRGGRWPLCGVECEPLFDVRFAWNPSCSSCRHSCLKDRRNRSTNRRYAKRICGQDTGPDHSPRF